MKTIDLTEEEIDGLHSYVEAVREIPMVECVYVLSFFSEATKEEKISVITIRSNNLAYNERLFGVDFIRDISWEKCKLREIMEEYGKAYMGGRFSFVAENDDFYHLKQDMSERQVLSERELVCGNILFDRFDDMSMNREFAKRVFKPFPNVLTISNIKEYYSRAIKGA